jgi:REP element-mobilizing transposase RayT
VDEHRTFFITTVARQCLPIFRVGARAQLLVEVLIGYRDQGKYFLHEFVLMPDHIHLLLTPAPEISLERAVQFIKGGYSHRLSPDYLRVPDAALKRRSSTSPPAASLALTHHPAHENLKDASTTKYSTVSRFPGS